MTPSSTVHSQAAEVIFDFAYEDSLYRIQRTKTRRQSDRVGILRSKNDGSWRPLTERSVRETEERIQQTLRMDYETFINASFFLQGNADLFAQQRPGDRKRILSSILGLEVWEKYRGGAAERRKRHERNRLDLDGLLEEINTELRQESDARARACSSLEEQLGSIARIAQLKEASLETLRRLALRWPSRDGWWKCSRNQRQQPEHAGRTRTSTCRPPR